MKIVISSLHFLMIMISSGALLPLIESGGARDEGASNAVIGFSFVQKVPALWALMTSVLLIYIFISRRFRFSDFNRDMVVLLAFCVLSAFWADVPQASFRVSAFVVIAYLFVTATRRVYGVEFLYLLLVYSSIALVVLSVVFSVAIPAYGVGVGVHDGKWQGVFDHKNVLGNFVGLTSLLVLGLGMRRLQTFSLIVCMFFILAMAKSDTAVASLIVGFCAYFAIENFKKLQSKRLAYKTIFSVVFLLSLMAVFFSLYQGEAQIDIFEKDSTFSGRNLIWIYAMGGVVDSPFFGHGIDQFSAGVSSDAEGMIAGVGFAAFSTHNGFVETAFGLGILGLIYIVFSIYKWGFPKGFGVRFGFGDSLIAAIIVFVVAMNTFEARLVGFNYYFIVLMYLIESSRIKRF